MTEMGLESFNNFCDEFYAAIERTIPLCQELVDVTYIFQMELRKTAIKSYRAAGYPRGMDEEAMWKWFAVELERVE